jgi:hypothetical protein
MAYLHSMSARFSMASFSTAESGSPITKDVRRGAMSDRNTDQTAARLRPELAAQHPSIPAHTWLPVLERNPLALHPKPDPDHVWLDVEGRARLLPREYFEFTKN